MFFFFFLRRGKDKKMNRFIFKRELVKVEEEVCMCRDFVVERGDILGSVERSREEIVDSKVVGDKDGAGDSLVEGE